MSAMTRVMSNCHVIMCAGGGVVINLKTNPITKQDCQHGV